MIDQSKITESKTALWLPKFIAIIIAFFMIYIGLGVSFSYYNGPIPDIFALFQLFESILAAGTTVLTLIILFSPNERTFYFSSLINKFYVIDKTWFADKYKIVEAYDLDMIKDVSAEEEINYRSRSAVRKYCYGLTISTVSSIKPHKLIFDINEEQINGYVEKINNVKDGKAEYFEINNYNYSKILENTFIALIILQIIINVNYIKQFILGTFIFGGILT